MNLSLSFTIFDNQYACGLNAENTYAINIKSFQFANHKSITGGKTIFLFYQLHFSRNSGSMYRKIWSHSLKIRYHNRVGKYPVAQYSLASLCIRLAELKLH